jgi:16S rRNA (adenine1518-N6/adenine1519-N6)-dimethyltransferase
LEADAQAIDVMELLGDPDPTSSRVLCGNLPYQITGRLLQLATTHAAHVDRVVFMVQDEVADRLIAAPGSKTYGALTVFTRAAFDVSRLMKVSRGSFHPAPDVTSSVIVLKPRRPVRAEETPMFRAVVKQAFAMRRKTLRNAWSNVASPEAIARAAAASGVSLDARGETLSVEQFAQVASALGAEAGGAGRDVEESAREDEGR